MAAPMKRDGLGTPVPDHTLVGRQATPTSQMWPVLEPTLTPADWLRVADALEAKATELETSEPEIAQIYRRDVALTRAQWTRI
jgi:hypothetical protein